MRNRGVIAWLERCVSRAFIAANRRVRDWL